MSSNPMTHAAVIVALAGLRPALAATFAPPQSNGGRWAAPYAAASPSLLSGMHDFFRTPIGTRLRIDVPPLSRMTSLMPDIPAHLSVVGALTARLAPGFEARLKTALENKNDGKGLEAISREIAEAYQKAVPAVEADVQATVREVARRVAEGKMGYHALVGAEVDMEDFVLFGPVVKGQLDVVRGMKRAARFESLELAQAMAKNLLQDVPSEKEPVAAAVPAGPTVRPTGLRPALAAAFAPPRSNGGRWTAPYAAASPSLVSGMHDFFRTPVGKRLKLDLPSLSRMTSLMPDVPAHLSVVGAFAARLASGFEVRLKAALETKNDVAALQAISKEIAEAYQKAVPAVEADIQATVQSIAQRVSEGSMAYHELMDAETDLEDFVLFGPVVKRQLDSVREMKRAAAAVPAGPTVIP